MTSVDAMKIRVLLFGLLAEAAGATEAILDLPPGSRVADLAPDLVARFDGLARSLESVAYAVNTSYVVPGHVLSDGDEVALIPPVSGG
ncbi:MAG: molybdopterin synthase sulfur carrier subunit [Planctomycetes bacterium]|nr:molybdopterin synthase sulfur carrier subunit [Planctomycetota bacterium]